MTREMRSSPGSFGCELTGYGSGPFTAFRELKGLAIILLVLHYARSVLGWDNTLQFDLGISVLFIVGGMTLGLAPAPTRAGPFLAGRLVRILPAYWIVLTLYGVCNVHFRQLSYSLFNVAIHYLGLQGWFGDAYGLAFAEPLCLVTLILAFPIFYSIGHPLVETPSRLLLVGAVIAAAVSGGYHFSGQSAMYSYLGQPLPGFFLGLILGRLLRTGRLEFSLGPALAAAAVILIYVPYINGIVFNAPLAGLSLIGLYLFVWKRLASPGARLRMARILTFFGNYWLEILLIYVPLIREYNLYLHGRWLGIAAPTGGSLLLGMAIGLAVTLVFSVALRTLLRKIPSSLLPAT